MIHSLCNSLFKYYMYKTIVKYSTCKVYIQTAVKLRSNTNIFRAVKLETSNNTY